MKLKGIFTGLLAGTLVGLFFAPKPGKEMRDKIQKERVAGGTGLTEFSKVAAATAGSFFDYLKRAASKVEGFVEEEFLDNGSDDDGGTAKKTHKKKK